MKNRRKLGSKVGSRAGTVDRYRVMRNNNFHESQQPRGQHLYSRTCKNPVNANCKKERTADEPS